MAYKFTGHFGNEKGEYYYESEWSVIAETITEAETLLREKYEGFTQGGNYYCSLKSVRIADILSLPPSSTQNQAAMLLK